MCDKFGKGELMGRVLFFGGRGVWGYREGKLGLNSDPTLVCKILVTGVT